jgi:putative hydrolase of the HAD superfamily
MTTPLLSPDTADALLFDLGRVVIDIDFDKALACWAGHAGCEPAHLVGRFARDEIYQRHETGSIDDAEFFASLRTSLGIDLSDA